MINYIAVTGDNVEQAKAACAAIDQRPGLVAGAETWGVLFGSQRGQMSRYPDGRGAVMVNADSEFGAWSSDWSGSELNGASPAHRVLRLDSGDYVVTEEGEYLDAVTGQSPEAVSR